MTYPFYLDDRKDHRSAFLKKLCKIAANRPVPFVRAFPAAAADALAVAGGAELSAERGAVSGSAGRGAASRCAARRAGRAAASASRHCPRGCRFCLHLR